MKRILLVTACGAAIAAWTSLSQPALAQQMEQQKHQTTGAERPAAGAPAEAKKHEQPGALQEKRAADEAKPESTNNEKRAADENKSEPAAKEKRATDETKPEPTAKEKNASEQSAKPEPTGKDQKASEAPMNRESEKSKQQARDKDETSKSKTEATQTQGKQNTEKRAGEESKGKAESKTTASGNQAASKFREANRGHELNEKQTADLSDRLRRHGRSAETNVNIDVRVGMTLPETVTFEPIPADIVVEYPQFRGYDYVMVHDEVVIVDPQSRNIVDVVGGPPTTRAAAVNPCEVQQQ
jgi:outer membrane biosynthesis protein TonB